MKICSNRIRVLEIAAMAGRMVKVSFNDKHIDTNTFEKYVKLFIRDGSIAYEGVVLVGKSLLFSLVLSTVRSRVPLRTSISALPMVSTLARVASTVDDGSTPCARRYLRTRSERRSST
jgi:hypothetical protein